MKKKLLLIFFFTIPQLKIFAQCTTLPGGPSMAFCGPGCFGNMTFTSSGGTPPYTLVVTGGPTVQYASSYNWTNICPGTYPYTVTDAALSCTDTGTVTVVSNPLPVVTASLAANICPGDTATLLATGALFYTWSPIANLVSASVDSSVLLVNPPVTTVYTAIGYTIEGCTDTDTVTVFIAPLPLLYTPPPANFCYGDSIVLTMTGAASYTWSPATGLSATTGPTVTAGPLSTTTYTVVGTSAQGCNNTALVTVTVNPLPSITFNVTNETCSACCDGSLTPVVIGISPFSYSWSNFSTNVTNTNLCAGAYSVTVTDANGCTSSSSATIGTGTCNPAFTVTPDNFTPHMYWITNNVTGTAPISYLWTWGDATSDTIPFPSHTYAQGGFYDICLSITDAAGCSCSNCWSSNLARMDATNTMISVTVVQQIPTLALGSEEENFILYPNPATGELKIKNEELKIEKIEIYNTIGKEVLSSTVLPFSSRRRSLEDEAINVSSLTSGIYFARIITADGYKTQKLIVQH